MYVKVVPMWCLLCGYKRMHARRNVDHGTCGVCCPWYLWSLLSAWGKVDIDDKCDDKCMSKFVPGHVLYIVSLVSAVWLHGVFGVYMVSLVYVCVMCGYRRMLKHMRGKLYINRA